MMRQFQANSYLFGGNAPYVEELYEALSRQSRVSARELARYFDALQHVPAADGNASTHDVAHAPIVESFAQRAKAGTLRPGGGGHRPVGRAQAGATSSR